MLGYDERGSAQLDGPGHGFEIWLLVSRWSRRLLEYERCFRKIMHYEGFKVGYGPHILQGEINRRVCVPQLKPKKVGGFVGNLQ